MVTSRRGAPVVSILLLATLAGCGDRAAGTIELRGDIGGLDTLGARGDSLLEQSRRPATLTDSGIVILPGVPEVDRPDTNAAEAITRRALARSDSLERLEEGAAVVAGRRSAADTLRGILRTQQRDGARALLLETGGQPVLLSGVATRGALSLTGLEVMVRGVAVTPRDLVVSTIIVRGFESLPALDGVITADGALRLTDGSGVVRRPLPAALRPLVGARVWIAYRNGQPVQFDRVER